MEIKVSRTTGVAALFGCILNVLEQDGTAELSAVGASALNQMFKAVALVFEKRGDTVRCTPKLSKNGNGTTFCNITLEVITNS